MPNTKTSLNSLSRERLAKLIVQMERESGGRNKLSRDAKISPGNITRWKDSVSTKNIQRTNLEAIARHCDTTIEQLERYLDGEISLSRFLTERVVEPMDPVKVRDEAIALREQDRVWLIRELADSLIPKMSEAREDDSNDPMEKLQRLLRQMLQRLYRHGQIDAPTLDAFARSELLGHDKTESLQRGLEGFWDRDVLSAIDDVLIYVPDPNANPQIRETYQDLEELLAYCGLPYPNGESHSIARG